VLDQLELQHRARPANRTVNSGGYSVLDQCYNISPLNTR